MEFAPAKPGEGYSFENATVGGVITKEFAAAVDLGIREASRSGWIGGYEVVDFTARLVDAQMHEVDSSELAFRIAGSYAFREAIKNGGSILLEPFMKCEIVLPEDYLGDVMGNVTARRGRIESMDTRAGQRVIDCVCPLSEMFGYATDLRSRTQGRGTFTMQFDHYEEVSKALADKILGIIH